MKSKLLAGLLAFALSSSLFAVQSIDVQFDLKNMASKSPADLNNELNRILILSLSLPNGEPFLCYMVFKKINPTGSDVHVWSRLHCEPVHSRTDASQEELTLAELEDLLSRLSKKSGIEMTHVPEKRTIAVR